MGTVGGAAGAKSFTFASGRQGTDVALAQIVLKTNTNIAFYGTILTNQGNDVTFSNPIIQIVPDIMPEPATCTLLGLAVAGCIGVIRRRVR